jgi:hypothetical protein
MGREELGDSYPMISEGKGAQAVPGQPTWVPNFPYSSMPQVYCDSSFLCLYRQRIIAKNEELYEGRSERSTSVTTYVYEYESDFIEDDSDKRQVS